MRTSSVPMQIFNNRSDGDALVSRQQLKQEMRQKSTQFARALPNEIRGCMGLNTARSRALNAAKEHVQDFYSAHINDKSNLAMSGMSAAEARQAGLDVAMTGRRASFASIARQADDLVKIVRVADDIAGVKMNRESRQVLAGVLDTLKLGAESMKLSAVENARLGRRALPLSLDSPRFSEFLRTHDHALQEVVDCCRNPRDSEARLQQVLTRFAVDYLSVNNQRPDRTLVQFAEFSGGTQQKSYDCTGPQETATLKLHRSLLMGGMQNWQNRLARFKDQPEAKQRASMILQTVIGGLTDLEEWIVAAGKHPTAGGQARMMGTREEHEYGGNPRLGDTVEDSQYGPSQRQNRLYPVVRLPEIAQQYESKHGMPLVNNRNLQAWIQSKGFGDDMRLMLNPASRLRIAQTDSTATALLNTDTFRR